ncbi:MAG: MBL fold metallo-hydrolase [Candidatus Parcubacteria bacterium]|nr:MBL fold metallo-hydrolase [Candidatus Parcubacteria bacterium]
MKAKITFVGGAGGPTGSNFLFETADGSAPLTTGSSAPLTTGKKILIDCGMTQGGEEDEATNKLPFSYDPVSIDALFVTHAHLDHIGRIPFLVKNGFRGKIYSTPPTRDIVELTFADELSIMGHDAQKKQTEPLYEREDVVKALSLWETADYGEHINVSEDLNIVLHDDGHVLGSAMVEVKYGAKKMLFTGDLGNSPSPLLRDTEYVKGIDYLLMESVYGDREHEDINERRNLLEDAIKKTIQDKGVLMIPIFSLERTQVLLFEINDLVEHGKIAEIPVFLDSPLGIKITEVYKKYKSYFNASALAVIKGGDDIFKFPRLKFTEDVQDSKAIHSVPPPKIVIAGSGMSSGGRILHHEKDYLPNPNNTLLLIGYQAVGTPGRLIQDGQKQVKIYGEMVNINARIVVINGYSAHRDTNGLLEFVEAMKDDVQKVFVVMGEPKAATFLSQRIHDYLGLKAFVPKRGESVELEF